MTVLSQVATDTEKLRVFISYSRDDLAFADQLDATLKLVGFNTTIDRHGIDPGEDWRTRLGGLIRDTDTVVFVLTPSSARSDICAWEVEEAKRLGKRILPVVPRSLDGAGAPPGLAALNYIYFYADPKKPGSSFGQGLLDLVGALNTDLEWLRELTRYLQRATEWDAGGRPPNRLLSGGDIALAKAWAARRPKDAPAPTGLHLDFIRASEDWEARQQSEERQRLQQMAEAQAARETALADKEAAQQREAAASRRIVRVTLAGLAAALLLAVAASGAGYFAYLQRGEALKTRDAALLTQSKFLADLSLHLTKQGDPGTGLLLALEALRDVSSDQEIARSRPPWAPAEISLEHARSFCAS